MNKPTGYDDAEAKKSGDFPRVPAGGYIAKIMTEEERLSQKGNPMLVLGIDIADGEFAGHYTKLSEKIGKPCYPQIFQLTEGNNLPYFKGLIKDIEDSNSGSKYDFKDNQLLRRVIGVNLREEEYENDKGELKSVLKVAQTHPVSDIRNGLVKPLPKKTVSVVKVKVETVHNGKDDSDSLPF